MKKISTIIFLMALVPPALWADSYSYNNEGELEQIQERSWAAAISTWPDFNIFISKDFFAEDSGLGVSTTSRLNLLNKQEIWLEEVQYTYMPLTFEQTGNIDLLIGWFHLQFQLGPSYSINLVEEDKSHFWKGYFGFVVGINLIISDRAVLSLQVRDIQITDQISTGTGGLYVGWRF